MAARETAMPRPMRRHDAHIRACHPGMRALTVHQLQHSYDKALMKATQTETPAERRPGWGGGGVWSSTGATKEVTHVTSRER